MRTFDSQLRLLRAAGASVTGNGKLDLADNAQVVASEEADEEEDDLWDAAV